MFQSNIIRPLLEVGIYYRVIMDFGQPNERGEVLKYLFGPFPLIGIT